MQFFFPVQSSLVGNKKVCYTLFFSLRARWGQCNTFRSAALYWCIACNESEAMCDLLPLTICMCVLWGSIVKGLFVSGKSFIGPWMTPYSAVCFMETSTTNGGLLFRTHWPTNCHLHYLLLAATHTSQAQRLISFFLLTPVLFPLSVCDWSSSSSGSERTFLLI